MGAVLAGRILEQPGPRAPWGRGDFTAALPTAPGFAGFFTARGIDTKKTEIAFNLSVILSAAKNPRQRTRIVFLRVDSSLRSE
jgi:hypothetical protein